MPSWKYVESTKVYIPVTVNHTGELPAGTYKSWISGITGERQFEQLLANSDKIYELPGLPTKYVLDQVQKFWASKEGYKKYGFLQKRGFLFYGPPGCGKSSLVCLLRKMVTDMNGVVFIPVAGLGFSNLSSAVSAFRALEPNRPIMTLVEDIETMLESSNGSNVADSEKAALALYDGEAQIDNVIHVATTNKPDAVADRFIRRPGRFDVVIGIHNPSRETRKMYLEEICNGHLTAEQRESILDKTEGLSLAYMREIASTYLVLGIPLEETVARLRSQSRKKYNTNKTGFTIGFTEEGAEGGI
jgi:hypothetical protein